MNRNESESENRFIDNWDDERLLEVGREEIEAERGESVYVSTNSKTQWLNMRPTRNEESEIAESR